MVDVAAVSLPRRSSFSGGVAARGYGLRRHDPGAATPPPELGGIRKSTVYRLLGYRIKDVPRETPGKRNVGRTKSSWFSFLRAIAISSRFPSTKSVAAFSNPRLPSPLESTSSAVLVAVVAMPACLAWAEPPIRGRLGGGDGRNRRKEKPRHSRNRVSLHEGDEGKEDEETDDKRRGRGIAWNADGTDV